MILAPYCFIIFVLGAEAFYVITISGKTVTGMMRGSMETEYCAHGSCSIPRTSRVSPYSIVSTPNHHQSEQQSRRSHSRAFPQLALVALTYILLLFLALLRPTLGVDRNNFKTCDQSGFCKLQRAVVEGSCLYELRLNSLKNDGEGKVVGELVQLEKEEEKLFLEIWGLKDNSVRSECCNFLCPIKKIFIMTTFVFPFSSLYCH